MGDGGDKMLTVTRARVEKRTWKYFNRLDRPLLLGHCVVRGACCPSCGCCCHFSPPGCGLWVVSCACLALHLSLFRVGR